MEKEALKLGKINHYHITMRKDICGGNPIVKGTRTSVTNIAGYYRLGLTPEEIKRELPHLNLAQVFDALAFYFDHREEIDRARPGRHSCQRISSWEVLNGSHYTVPG